MVVVGAGVGGGGGLRLYFSGFLGSISGAEVVKLLLKGCGFCC